MEFLKNLTFIASGILMAGAPVSLPAQAEPIIHSIYMMQSGEVFQAIDRYQAYAKKHARQEFNALQQMGLVLLKQGIQSENPQVFMMALFGAGLSGSAGALEILEKGLLHPDPQIQMLALHFIAKIDDDRTDELLSRAMTSDFLSTRMEASFYMAHKKHPHAVGQIEGLMHRLPPFFKPFFPSLFALIGTSDATQVLKKLADDIDPQVRIESILNIARLGRDDLLPMVRKRLTHTHIAELEATLFAIGALKDSSSLPKLKKLAQSPSENIKIAAIAALNALGDRSQIFTLDALAQTGHLHAIALAGALPGLEETLATQSLSSDLAIRINASVALLQRRDPRCLKGIKEILIKDSRDLAFQLFPSLGRTMTIWKAIPSAELRDKDPMIDLSLSLSLREHLLQESANLPPDLFLQLVKELFIKQQFDLIPTATALLENLRTPEAIALLKEGSRTQTAPLLRGYCQLSLFRLNEEGPYETAIKNWVMRQKEVEFIHLRPMLPWKMRLDPSNYTLTPEETSRLLVESFVAIASRQDEKNIDFLLDAIKLGHPQNRYPLFGLLMRATE